MPKQNIIIIYVSYVEASPPPIRSAASVSATSAAMHHANVSSADAPLFNPRALLTLNNHCCPSHL